jgi:hypothetical protein
MFHNVQREGEIYGITVKIRSNYLIRGGPAATLPTPQLKGYSRQVSSGGRV